MSIGSIIQRKIKSVAPKLEYDSTCELNTNQSCEPNWEYQEVMALIQARKDKYVVALDVVHDLRD